MIVLGGPQMAASYNWAFPAGHSTFGQDFWPQLEVTFEKFYYFQGGFFRNLATSALCKSNAQLEAGLDQNAEPLLCAAGFTPYHEVSRCVKDNSVPVTICEHDMVSEGSKCFRCRRGYGRLGQGLCFKCPDNCQLCTGPSSQYCLACDERYSFDGSACRPCDGQLQTYDGAAGVCQAVQQHNSDLWGGPKTLGGVG